tara:strand:+ start:224 stop:2095 length:1872 start_codon:yes stop_codon:yes gene_type:complete
MVTFITDPRIAYAQAARDDYRKRSLAPIQLPRNPYGASPLASALQNLTYGYLAGQEGRQASRLQEAQTAAQNKIMGQILQSSRARPPGEGGYLSQSMVSPPDPTGMRAAVGDTLPPQTQVSVNRPARPATQPIDASLAKTAGIMPAQLEMLRMKAIQQGDAATAKKIAEEAQRGLQNALLQNTPEGMQLAEQYGAILDPASSLTRQRQLADKGVARDQTVADTAARNLREDTIRKADNLREETLYDVRQAGTRAYNREKTEEAREQAEKVARGKIVGVFDTTKNSNVFVTAGKLIDDKEGKFAPKRTDARATYPTRTQYYPLQTGTIGGRSFEKGVAVQLTREEIETNPELQRAFSTGSFTTTAPSTAAKTTFFPVYFKKSADFGGRTYNQADAPTFTQEQMDSSEMKELLASGAVTITTRQPVPEPPSTVPTLESLSSSQILTGENAVDVDSPEAFKQIVERGSNTVENDTNRLLNILGGYFFNKTFSPETLEATAKLEAMRLALAAPLIKSVASRGGTFAWTVVQPLLPSQDNTPSQNYQNLRNLIVRYEEEEAQMYDQIINSKKGSKKQLDAREAYISIIQLKPRMQKLLDEAASSSGAGVTGGNGSFTLGGGIRVRKVD